MILQMKKILSSFLVAVLLFGTVGGIVTDASPLNVSTDLSLLSENPNFYLSEGQLEETDEKIGQYLDTETISGEVFEEMSDAEQDAYIENMLNSEEYIQLENELMQIERLDESLVSTENNGQVTTFALPLLAPVAAYVARVALKTIAKKGTAFAKKYMKGKLDKIGDNYDVLWTQPNSLVVVLQGSGKNKKRVFAIDHSKIPLKPGTTKKVWHYHITPNVGMHHTLCSFIPAGHKPDTKTKCY